MTQHFPTDPQEELTANQLKAVAAYMRRHALVLTTAESCTAGLIAAHLADVPGAGSLLECAYVVYTPEAKQHCLGLSDDILARYNLTSEEVAGAMARGALRKSRATVAIANTGVTDDTDPRIPPGTQCFAWLFVARGAEPEQLFTETRRFSGNRRAIREQAATHALTQIPGKHTAVKKAPGRAGPAAA